jgi:nicotinamidase-related amidase
MAGASDLRLPDELRGALHAHLDELRQGYERRGWARRVGFGRRPAVVVIDLALAWTDPHAVQLGSDLDSVVAHTARILETARAVGAPIFFSTMMTSPDDPPNPGDRKLDMTLNTNRPGSPTIEIDPRLGRRPTEKLIVKKYASCFKGTDLMEMLVMVGADTLIITGCSTSHCVYATSRDACSGLHVIVPREAVGDRCELLHEVALFDIDLNIGDVVPTDMVVAALRQANVGG